MAEITFKGNLVNTSGSLPIVGSTLKEFTLVKDDLSEKTLTDYAGKKMILSIFPSVDTGVCATALRKFNEKAGTMENTVVLNISKDLPFALKRFCAAEGLEHVENLSDFRGSFGLDYGVIMTDGPLKGLLSRSVIVANEKGEVIYTEQVPEIAQEPNYDAAIAALK